MKTPDILAKMELIGLIKEGKAISFNQFKKIADPHQYGSRSNKIYIVYYGHPRQNLFAFYPPQTTKKESLMIAYQYLLLILNILIQILIQNVFLYQYFYLNNQ